MNRQTTLLAVLAAVLLLVVGYLFVVKPKQGEIADIRTEIEDAQAQQSQVRAQISQLEAVRASIPEVEAALAAAETIIPRDEAELPAALRMLQMAANDSGVQLDTVSMSRPEVVATEAGVTVPADLSQITVSVSLSGGYFQIVDFLRRTEDPVLTPRAILWSSSAVSLDEYPTLTVTLAGTMYAYLEDIGAEPAPAPTDAGTATEEDVDVDVDVDVTETETAT